jgi:hypothetical protein
MDFTTTALYIEKPERISEKINILCQMMSLSINAAVDHRLAEMTMKSVWGTVRCLEICEIEQRPYELRLALRKSG